MKNNSNTLSALAQPAVKLLFLSAFWVASCLGVRAASVVFDDFNVNVGHFNQAPTFSGSTVGLLTASASGRVTIDDPVEGDGHMRLTLITNGAASARCRFLSGGGTIANNTPFTTSAAEDGWIGLYVKTTNTGWTVQIWIEGASNNGSVPKTVIADGQYHLYEWNLDDNSGGADGWGDIQGILGGSPTVTDGSHTIDSVIFRNAAFEAQTNVLFMDFVAKSASGSVANLLLDPCLNTSGVVVNGPLSSDSNEVVVVGVSESATEIKVYQDSGSGMVPIGSKTTGIVAGNNAVTVSGLVKAAQVAATQTVSGQESCVPTLGIICGGGANPAIRIALTIRELTNTSGTIGMAAPISGQTSLHFLGASAVVGGAPINAPIVYPSNEWQTVTFDLGRQTIDNSDNATGTVGDAVDFNGYPANNTVAIQVYAFKTIGDTRMYSPVGAASPMLTSNDTFTVTWSWDTVTDAEGYRLLRNWNEAGFTASIDVVGSNTLFDTAFYPTEWIEDLATVTPKFGQTGPSVQWNPTVSNTNNLPGEWGALESINFVIGDLTDTGPYDIFIDNIQNGTTVFQTFEEAAIGATGYGFQAPSFSGTTSGGILTAPNSTAVSGAAADTGTKSLRVQWQWNGLVSSKWLRLTTSTALPASNPFVDLQQPISFRILLLPVGSTPVPPLGPVTVTGLVGTSLDYTGGGGAQFVLVKSADINTPMSSWTRVATNTVTPGSFTIPVGSETQAFYGVKSE